MTRENAKKLQSTMAKEAVTLLMLGGAEADTAEHEEAIRLIGEELAGAVLRAYAEKQAENAAAAALAGQEPG